MALAVLIISEGFDHYIQEELKRLEIGHTYFKMFVFPASNYHQKFERVYLKVVKDVYQNLYETFFLFLT